MEADTAPPGHTGEGTQSRAMPSPDHADGVAGLEAQRADMRDRRMRAEAEIVNIKTRAKRDLGDAKRYAVQTFATDVVKAAENLRRGLDSWQNHTRRCLLAQDLHSRF